MMLNFSKRNICRSGRAEFFLVFVVFTFAIIGCQHQKIIRSTPVVLESSDEYLPTDRLIKTISRADRILVLYRFPDREPATRDFVMTISGNRVKQIVHAMSGAIVPDDGIPKAEIGIFDWELQFHRRGKLLGVVKYTGDSFSYDGRIYTDRTGVLMGIFVDVFKVLKQ